MKLLSMLAVVVTLGMTLGIGDAEAAKRFGSGKSSGMQRQMTPPAKAPDAAAGAKQATPATATAAAPAAGAAPAAAAQTGRSWMGPVAGLAAGLGLAALASHFGFGEELASFMMMALLALVVIAAIGFFMRKRAAGQQPALAGAGANRAQNAFQYATDRVEPGHSASAGRDISIPAASAGTDDDKRTVAADIPADFDVVGFVRNAKVHYIRLQAANDAGNLDDIREFTTPEMFAEIKLTMSERAGQAQVTDVLAIEADVIGVAEEDGRYVVSTRFTGQIREDNGPAESVDEIWHLIKPRNGSGGWLLAGIQQVQ